MIFKRLISRYLQKTEPLTNDEYFLVCDKLENLVFNAYANRADSGISWVCYQLSKQLLTYITEGKQRGIDIELTLSSAPAGFNQYLDNKIIPGAPQKEDIEQEEARLKAMIEANLNRESEAIELSGISKNEDE